MKTRWRLRPLGLGLALAALVLLPAQALAADLRQGQNVTVPAGETVSDDAYIGASAIDVPGTIDGTLTAAGGSVRVSGTITRDLMVAAGTVDVTGDVAGSIRATGGTVNISGTIGRDVVMAGGTLNLEPGAQVGRDVLAGGGTVTLAGNVARHVRASAGRLILQGPVGGDVTAQVTNLEVQDGARIAGALTYTSDNVASIASGAVIAGAVQHNPATTPSSSAQRFAGGLVGWIRNLVGLFALGLILVLVFPAFSRRTAGVLEGSPWLSAGIGAAVLIGVPIAALLVFLVGLLVGGWWLGAATLGLYALALAVALVLASLFIGGLLLRLLRTPAPHPLVALLVGLVVVTLAGLIPFAGGAIEVLLTVFGLGGLTLALAGVRPSGPAPATVPAAPPIGAPRPAL